MDLSVFELRTLRAIEQVERRQRADNPLDGGAHQTDIEYLLSQEPLAEGIEAPTYRRTRAALYSLTAKGLVKLWPGMQNTFTLVDRDVVSLIGRLE